MQTTSESGENEEINDIIKKLPIDGTLWTDKEYIYFALDDSINIIDKDNKSSRFPEDTDFIKRLKDQSNCPGFQGLDVAYKLSELASLLLTIENGIEYSYGFYYLSLEMAAKVKGTSDQKNDRIYTSLLAISKLLYAKTVDGKFLTEANHLNDIFIYLDNIDGYKDEEASYYIDV